VTDLAAPPIEILRALSPLHRQFIDRLLAAVALERDARATSWWRDRVLNADVGGHPQSQHLLGFAVDVAVAQPAAFVAEARAQGLVALDEGTHVHVQAFDRGSIPPSIFDSLLG